MIISLLFFLWLQSQFNFAVLDEHVKKTPQSETKSVETLTRYLSRAADSKKEMTYLIYSWIAQNVSYDVRSYRRGIRSNRNEQVLRYRTAVCEGYATLFNLMAKEADIETEIIEGRARGSSDLDRYIPHAWNAVKVNGKWNLLDATWGSGYLDAESGKFKAEFNRYYFFTNPEQLITSHLPDLDKWQLLEKAKTKAEIKYAIQGSPNYYNWNINPLTHLKNMFESDGFEKISVKVPNSIYTAVQLSDTKGNVIPSYHHFIIKKDDYVDFYISFPKKGEYEFHIFGKDDVRKEMYQSLFAYKVKSKSKGKRQFPESYETYAVNRLNMISPEPNRFLSSEDSLVFDIETNAFKEMAIINNGVFDKMNNFENRFYKKVLLRSGEVLLGGTKVDGNEYEILLKYQVK